MKSLNFKSIIFLTIFPLILFAYLPVISQVKQKGKGVRVNSVSKLPAKEKRWALIIGVDKYRDSNISNLSGAANDAETLASSLEKYAGFPKDQIIILTTKAPLQRQPNRTTILKYLSNLKGLVPEDGLFLISFSGHGIERKNRAFLIPSDAVSTDDVDLLEETAISVERMKDQIRSSPVQQVLFLIDACRNDPTSSRSDADNPLTENYTRGFSFDVKNKEVEAFATIYATSVGGRAYEYAEKGQGYFSWAVVEALSGEAANKNGEITLGGLVQYIENRVPKMVAIDLGIGKVQKPFAIIGGYKANELVLAVNRSKVQPIPQPIPQPVPTPATVIAKVQPTPQPNPQSVPTPAIVIARVQPTPQPVPTPAPVVENAKSVEDTFWGEINGRNTIYYYQKYLSQYPNGKYTSLAKMRMGVLQIKVTQGLTENEEEKWEELAGLNTIESYQNYIEIYPKGKYRRTADLRISKLELLAIEEQKWQELAILNTIESYQNYLEIYPEGKYRRTADLRILNFKPKVAEVDTFNKPKAGTIMKRPIANGLEMEFAWIPEGAFTMGSPSLEDKRDNDESPLRLVKFADGFWMGKYEVTQEDYEKLLGTNPSFFTNCQRCPVEKVSWNDAKEFIKGLNSKNDGFTYSLPSEAEWEYAARSGNTTPFGIEDGINLSSDNANFNGSYPYGITKQGKNLKKTTNVGSYQANAWGLYDMHGNVWEWVEDIYQDSYDDLPTNGSANLSLGYSNLRGLRGGSWFDLGYFLRSANRFNYSPTVRFYFVGFRVVARPSNL